jgi:hypothetical protein
MNEALRTAAYALALSAKAVEDASNGKDPIRELDAAATLLEGHARILREWAELLRRGK